MNYPTGNAAGDDHPAFHIPTGFEDELDRELAALQREFESGSAATPAFAASNEVSEFGDAAVEAIAFMDAAETQYRDATHAFANGGSALDLALQAEAFTESNFFIKGSSAAPQFVMDKSMAFKKTPVASPLSPSSYQFESSALPEKEVGFDSFLHVNPAFSSHSTPDKVMDALQRSLKSFTGCSFSVEHKWTLRVSWVCVAEEITFSIALSRPRGSSTQCDVDFHLLVGDEAKFVELAECIRSQCSEVDDEALFFLSKTLEPWMDATQELKGRRYAIDASEAASLIADMNAELHADTLYEVAKTVKNHCRHKGNRRLFLQMDRSSFLMALRGMLGDSEEVARFAVFILQQFAKDELQDSAAFFASAFDRNSFALLLEGLAKRETSSACAQFTHSMVEQVQHSWIFA